MPAQLQITCNPDDWDASVLNASGISLPDGRTLAPRTVAARELPADLLTIWREAVAQISGIDPGGWAARHIIATRAERIEAPPEEYDHIVDYMAVPYLALTIRRAWLDSDARALASAPDILLAFDSAAMLHFFDSLTSPAYWLPTS